VARPLLAVLALMFVAFAARNLVRRWDGTSLRVSALPVAACWVPLVAGTLALALSWRWLVTRMAGTRPATLPAMALHLESQMARYMPGKVGVPVIRMAGAPQLGVSARAVGASVMVETLSLMAVGATFSFALLAITSDRSEGVIAMLGRGAIPMTVLGALGTLGLVVVDRRFFPRALMRALKTEGKGPLVPPALPLVHLCYWLLWAVHGYVVSRAVGASHADAIASAGLYSLAPVVGFIVLVAPAGIGVREALLSFGLAPAVGPAGALTAALISRTASLLADVGTWICFRRLAGRPPS